MPLIPALRRQRQVDLCEFQASQGYKEKICLKQTNGSRRYEWKNGNQVFICLMH
ncbi:growth hormone receptor, isoform CRA_a [Rattus norvegicus]|uniref:Growth hormone receptor, isoform CRA_a n=1 Tax=Rattus norvegicus TaxID=10116 RepID=A6KGC2_RAT|nr:growth hormone receptor, isoform CRA_a [Rattus norvegicus]